jgi:hypothetical protein
MTRVSSPSLDLDHPKRKLELIMDHDDPLRGDLKKLSAGRDALAAQVHEGLWFQEGDRRPRGEAPLPIDSFELLLGELNPELISELINDKKTDIMSSLSILRPRVS